MLCALNLSNSYNLTVCIIGEKKMELFTKTYIIEVIGIKILTKM